MLPPLGVGLGNLPRGREDRGEDEIDAGVAQSGQADARLMRVLARHAQVAAIQGHVRQIEMCVEPGQGGKPSGLWLALALATMS